MTPSPEAKNELNFFDKMINVARCWNTFYGHVRMFKTTTNHIYVEYYNAGWSENEELEQDLAVLGNVVVTKHPIMLLHINPKEYAILYKMKENYWESKINELESLCNIPTEIKDKYEVNL